MKHKMQYPNYIQSFTKYPAQTAIKDVDVSVTPYLPYDFGLWLNSSFSIILTTTTTQFYDTQMTQVTTPRIQQNRLPGPNKYADISVENVGESDEDYEWTWTESTDMGRWQDQWEERMGRA